MRNRYEEIMDRIEVTEEMKVRIMNRLQAESFSAPPEKVIPLRKIRRLASLAACLAILAAGVWGIVSTFAPTAETPSDSAVQVIPEIVNAASAEELSELVGFAVTDVEHLPFESSETTYTAYWGDLAEIQYQGDREEAVFRKSTGDGDNSGDSNFYDTTGEITVDGVAVLLKGNSGRYTLAIWSADGFSYSLSISCGATVEEWAEMIAETA